MIVNTRRVFLQLLRALRIDVVCEVGSFGGADTRRFRRAAPRARIIAFEPHPENLRRMRADPSLRDGRVEISSLAVSNYDGTGQLFAPRHDGRETLQASSLYGASALREVSSAIPVETSRLDTFLGESLDARRRLALWIDAVGHSHEVLEGAAGVAPQVELLHIQIDSQACVAPHQKTYPHVRALADRMGLEQIATSAPTERPQFHALYVRRELRRRERWAVSTLLAAARGRHLVGRGIRALAGSLGK
ncbi:MAG: FkbM family methyltransferase [Myxococcales bacterium]|nr:FkbM family methyltransferase [Myxococcales bacterium]